MRIILTSFIVLSVCIAMAAGKKKYTQTITCSFTEPFFTLTYNVEEASLAITEPNWESADGEIITKLLGSDLDLKSVSKDPLLPSFQIDVPNEGKTLKMIMNFAGSDAVSDETYPLDAQWVDTDGSILFGGCVTNKIKSVSTKYNSHIITGPGDIKL